MALKPVLFFLLMVFVAACDDTGAVGGATTDDAGSQTADGSSMVDSGLADQGRPDAATRGPDQGPTGCADTSECTDGQICVEGACADCLGNGECGELESGVCLEGRCCAGGTEDCSCAPGCGPGLACEGDRCVACPEGTLGCGCGDGCDDNLECTAGVCGECPDGTEGCGCGPMGCDPGLSCADTICEVVPVIGCDDLDCAEQGRTCEGEPAARCGDCDLAAGFIAQGEACVELLNCDQDLDCADGELCLQLAPGRRSKCTPRPDCLDLEPLEGQVGASWSGAAAGCVECDACAGFEGATGRLWPTTSDDGECICETVDGYYHDVAVAVGKPRPCDADGDGWVQRPAAQYVDSDDDAIAANARCEITHIERVVLVNERGETRTLQPEALLAPGPLPRYEPVGLDEQDAVDDDRFIPIFGEGKPAPAELNPLRKFCATADADFNGNGRSDVREHGGSEARFNWMQPFLRISYFGELHQARFADGTLTISEVPRCADGFPFDYQGAGNHWRECERRRPATYLRNTPGFDFGEWSCEAGAGSCPGLTAAELNPAGEAIVTACSGAPSGRFTGMNHSSQFQCVLLDMAPTETYQRAVEDDTIELQTCVPSADGFACEARARDGSDEALGAGDIGWALERLPGGSGEDYTRGCVAECEVMQPLCPGAQMDAAGCTSGGFGMASCNGCPGVSDAPCPTGLSGWCEAGKSDCVDGEAVCGVRPEVQDAIETAGGAISCDPDGCQQSGPTIERDDPFDSVDDNCDGFGGVIDRAIFVDLAARRSGTGRTSRPYFNLELALEHVRVVGGSGWSIYVTGASDRPVDTLVVPPGVSLIIGGLTRDCAVEGTWCEGPDRTSLGIDAPVGFVISGREDELVIRNFDVMVDPDVDRLRGDGADGFDIIGLKILDGSVVLDGVALETADAPDGLAGPPPAKAAADNGAQGVLGSSGCQEAGRSCDLLCPDDYWTSGRGGACQCGGGDACGGGDGGFGGVARGNNCVPGDEEPPADGRRGSGVLDGEGGPAGTELCAGDDNPVLGGSNGGDGSTGDAAQTPGRGFFGPQGWIRITGDAGRQGGNGTGGGGGGGGAGSNFDGEAPCRNRGGHGAGGGSGGCGGLGGSPGGGGGASIGALVSGGRLTLRGGAVIQAGAGGTGGPGSPGQLGGAGGDGGAADGVTNKGHAYAALQDDAGNGARGGDGGNGGNGGAGAGGTGGPSVAVILGVGAQVTVEGPADLEEGVDPAAAALLCGAPGAGGPSDAPEVAGMTAPDFQPLGCTNQPPLVECELPGDCGPGADCIESACVPRLPLDAECADHSECASEWCDDGACAARGGEGADCGSDAACLEGACVDGICARTCNDHPRCGDAAWCDDGICVPREINGGLCGSARERCISDYCHVETGLCSAPCGRHENCPDADYCDGNLCIPRNGVDGECSNNDDRYCEEGLYCLGDTCREQLDIGGGCAVSGGDRACISGICDINCVSCAGDGDCPNGYCDRGLSGAADNACTPFASEGDDCGRDAECNGELVCREGQCRAACANDAACNARAWCSGDSCWCQAGACKQRLPDGTACVDFNDRICQNECVGVVCRACDPADDAGCAAGQTCDQFTCRREVADGGACTRDNQCRNDRGCVGRVCRKQCLVNGDCSGSQYCDSFHCQPREGVGGGCLGNAGACASGLYCDISVCSECLNNGHCPGEYCEGNGLDANTCEPRKDLGDGCRDGTDCASGFCDSECVECLDNGDCGGGQYCDLVFLGVNRCRDKLANGENCGGDANNCASGLCDIDCVACLRGTCGSGRWCDNPALAQNRCRSKRSNGTDCSEARQCRSNRCTFCGFDGTFCTANGSCP